MLAQCLNHHTTRPHSRTQNNIIIIIIIHEFQSDASPEELQGRCSVTVFSLWLWPVTRTAEPPDKQFSLQSAPKTVDSRRLSIWNGIDNGANMARMHRPGHGGVHPQAPANKIIR